MDGRNVDRGGDADFDLEHRWLDRCASISSPGCPPSHGRDRSDLQLANETNACPSFGNRG